MRSSHDIGALAASRLFFAAIFFLLSTAVALAGLAYSVWQTRWYRWIFILSSSLAGIAFLFVLSLPVRDKPAGPLPYLITAGAFICPTAIAAVLARLIVKIQSRWKR